MPWKWHKHILGWPNRYKRLLAQAKTWWMKCSKGAKFLINHGTSRRSSPSRLANTNVQTKLRSRFSKALCTLISLCRFWEFKSTVRPRRPGSESVFGAKNTYGHYQPASKLMESKRGVLIIGEWAPHRLTKNTSRNLRPKWNTHIPVRRFCIPEMDIWLVGARTHGT